MATVTEVGKELRVLRVNRDITRAADMAKALDISPAYLHAIETGKRRVPNGFMDSVLKAYALTVEEKGRLHRAVARTAPAVYLDDAPPRVRDLVLALVRQAHTLDEMYLRQIARLVGED